MEKYSMEDEIMNSKKLARYILEIHECAERFSEAEYQKEQGNINHAIKLHKLNIESDVNYPASYFSLAKLYHELGDSINEKLILKKAIDECESSDVVKNAEFHLKKLEKNRF